MTLERVDLFAPSGLRLQADGSVEVETPPRMSGEQDGWVVASFHVESTADVHGDHWEIHPFGQEVVSVLSGQARLVLRPETDQAPEEAVTLPAGTACVVPRNRWHRIEIDGPTDMQSITPRRGTRLEPRA
jgi:oxalate decarboxylase/phosphoglucose isomerase-like protein (cupin superfamily)